MRVEKLKKKILRETRNRTLNPLFFFYLFVKYCSTYTKCVNTKMKNITKFQLKFKQQEYIRLICLKK